MASILPFLVLYVLTTPDFAGMLVTNSTALGRFLRQVMTNGLPVVFLVNYLGFVFAFVTLRHAVPSQIKYIALDGLLRGVIFVGVHVVVYVLSADLFSSFGGSRSTALSVVGPTLKRSFLFANISGVYLYALAPGALISILAVLSDPGNRTRAAGRARVWQTAMVASLIPVPVVTVLSIALKLAT